MCLVFLSGLTDGVCFSRQLNAAVLQLLHALLQIHLLLHECGEALLEHLHGPPQSLVHLQGNAAGACRTRTGIRITRLLSLVRFTNYHLYLMCKRSCIFLRIPWQTYTSKIFCSIIIVFNVTFDQWFWINIIIYIYIYFLHWCCMFVKESWIKIQIICK